MGEARQKGHADRDSGFPRRFGKYTLLSQLAQGGMAEVFLARQLGPAGFEKECVIKRILSHLARDPNNQSFIDMFLDEARIVARLSHPNIVHIFDLGQVDGDYFLALEYVDGIDMESLLERAKAAGQPALPWPISVRIVSNVAEGLEHAHKAKDSAGNPLLLVHRDISPSNIMVSWDGVAKILDFGIAKAVAGYGKVRTGVGIIKGKIPYMSPEQIQGLELDGRSDIFSLAVVLYELLTGQRPFPGDTTGQLTLQIAGREPRDPESINPGFPRDLWPVLKRAMAKSTAERYQSARDFKMALEQFLGDQLVSCTNYDVEAYLRELVPSRPRPQMPSAEEIARVESDSMEAAPVPASPSAGERRASNPPRRQEPESKSSSVPPSADPSKANMSANTPVQDSPKKPAASGRRDESSGPGIDVLEAENAALQRRHRQGSGSLIMGAIALLVLFTAVVFYVLHKRALNQTEGPAGDTTTAAPATPPPPPTPPAAAAPATPSPAAPEKAPEKPAAATAPAAEKPAPEKAAKAEKPAADATAEKPAKTEKAAAKAERPKSRPAPGKRGGDDAPKGISNLPLPPPSPPEP
jgi:serine/threonine-protein kinase